MLKTAKLRSKLTQEIRDFFTDQNFLEVETPIMVTTPGMEPHLSPFESELKTPQGQTHKVYLNHSPELQMKKLLAQDFGNIFSITKSFRNGEVGGGLHNPEFSMLEWYRNDANYQNLMTDCEKLITTLSKNPASNLELPSAPWPRKTCQELFQEHCNISLIENQSFEEFAQAAQAQNLDINACQDWDDIFFKLFLNHIEPKLGPSPVFVTDYPASQAALARLKPDNPFFAERFELYIGGLEIANAFSELTDSEEQRKRLEEEQELRRKLQKPVFPIDEEFLTALDQIKDPCAGIALGVDRLMMLLLNKKRIEDVILFPISNYI